MLHFDLLAAVSEVGAVALVVVVPPTAQLTNKSNQTNSFVLGTMNLMKQLLYQQHQ